MFHTQIYRPQAVSHFYKLVIGSKKHHFNYVRTASTKTLVEKKNSTEFETVFSFPFVKYFALFQRLKVYQIAGCAIALPTCGVLEALSVIPQNTLITASYIGISMTMTLSLFSLPFRNIIGFIYVSKDNKTIKISYVNFWGKRKDQIVSSDNWIPLMDLQQNLSSVLYLSPKLEDGTVYKLFLKFGKVTNEHKMSNVLE